jgi:deoxyribonuclease-4
LASPDDELWTKSIDAMVIELERAHRLGIEHVVAHPGAHMGTGEEAGLARIARAIEIVLGRTADLPTSICLETTAGQGSTLGYRFEHLGWLMSRLDAGPRLTACVDSCHVVAAGYALSPRKDYLATMEAFGEAVGFERLVALHINDSKKPLGSRVDRHEHIGRGCLGLEPFEHLVNDPRLAKLPMYLETAKEDEPTSGRPWDAINLETLRSLMSSQAAKKSTSTKRVKGSAGRK